MALWQGKKGRMGKRVFGKVDVVHILADRHGYRRYLEVVTPTTGHFYADIDRTRFEACRRLMYRCPPDFDDEMAIDYHTEGSDISAPAAAIAEVRPPFDIMLVDPYHGYDDSFRDLETAFALLAPGGAMVVHDCLPPREEIAGPAFQAGGWCGVTYKAFLDFVLGRNDLRYFTVDTDYGCGVILKRPEGWRRRLAGTFDFGRRRMIVQWRRLGSDYSAVWRFFEANKAVLLRLVSIEDFKADEASDAAS